MSGSLLMVPIITEKMHNLQESDNSYAFKVLPGSNKLEIKKAVEERFGVHVKQVRTMNLKGKSRIMSVKSGGHVIRTSGKKSNWKKAIVTLLPGESIDIYGNEPS